MRTKYALGRATLFGGGKWIGVLAMAWGFCLPLFSQGWQRVVQLNDLPGSAIGGGSGNTLYAGLNAGHVFRSDDNGLTWSVMTNGLVDDAGRMLLPKAFVVTPSGRVIRGGDNASWQNKAGSPIFTTDNRGARWNESPLPFGSPARNPGGIAISDLVVHQGILYFSDLLSEGVWKSADNGGTWTAVGEGLPTVPFIGFAKTYYALASAGTSLLTVEPTRGVFRSTDGGATWSQAVNGIAGVPNSPLLGGRTWTGNDVVGAPDGTAFAVVDGRAYRSRDGGASWAEIGAGILVGPNPFVPSVIEPKARKIELLGDRVFLSTADGNPRFFEGTQLGEAWTELPRLATGGAPGSILAQSFYAYNNALYFAGTNGVHRLDLATAVRTNLMPVVATNPSGPFGVNVGGVLRIAARVTGTAPYTYEWRLDDQPIPGQTSAELNYVPVSGIPSGALTLVVRNAAGSVTHDVGRVTVAPVAPGAIDYSFRPVVSANSFGVSTVTAFAVSPDGSVFLAGAMLSQAESYTGIRKVFADGRADPSFLSGTPTGGGTGPGSSSGPPSVVLPLGDGSVLVGAAGTGANVRYYRRLLADGTWDAEWPWPAEIAGGPRKILRLADGRFMIAGGSNGGLHRLLADGTYDPSFQGPSSIGRFQQNYVKDFAILPDGRILIVGVFSTVDGWPRVSIARLLPNGSLDAAWVPAALPAGSEIYALAVLPDGRILIGGAFLTVGGQAHRNLALLRDDGSVDPALADLIPNTSPAGVVNAFAVQPDGRIWVGGAFRGVSGRNYVFRLNTDLGLDTGFPDLGFEATNDGGVQALAFAADGRLWIGCGTTTLNGGSAGQLFRIFTDVHGPTVGYAGLDQTPILGEPVTLRATVPGPYTGLEWRFKGQALAGANSLEWSLGPATSALSGPYDLVVTSAGGSFTSAPVMIRPRGPVVFDQQPVSLVGIVSNSVAFGSGAFGRLPISYQWFREGAEIAGATNRWLTLTNLQLSASGDYQVRATGSDGSTATSEPAFLTVIPPPGSINTAFRPGLFRTTAYTVFKDIAFQPDGRMLVAGNFAVETNGPNAFLARLQPDGSVDSTFRFDASGVTEVVGVERQSDGRWVVLLRTGSYEVRRLNEDGSLDGSFPVATLDSAFDLALAPDGGIVTVGSLGIQRLGPNGLSDDGFNQRSRLSGSADALAVDPAGRIYVSGSFTAVGGQPSGRFARLLADGALDTSFAPTNVLGVGKLTALPEGVLYRDNSGFYRFAETGQQDRSYAWSSRLEVWDLDPAGNLVGVLPGTTGDGVIRRADGTPALPASTMKVPGSFNGYSFIRVGPDGSLWLAMGGSGLPEPPSTKLYRLNGTVTPLALLTAPESKTVNAGARVTLVSGATGTSKVAYQWQRNGAPLAGQTNAQLVFENVRPQDSGDYTVVVSNRSGILTSRPATLIVLDAPEIVRLSGGGSVVLGDTLLLSVGARGVPPLSYQWRRNGIAVAGASFADYTNRAVALANVGSYDVVVSNARGAVTSAPLAVAVVVRPGAVVSSLTSLSAGSGMELNLLPSGDFLVDDKAYNRFGELLFRLAFPDGTSTVLRDRIVVDSERQRILAGPTRRVRSYALDGTLIDGFAGPNANVRMVRVEAGGSVLQSTEGVNLPFQRLDGTTGALVSGFNPASVPSLDAQPLPDGKTLVLTFSQRTVSGRVVYNTQLSRLLLDGSNDATFDRQTNAFPGGGQATRLWVDRQGRILVLGGTGVADTERLARFNPDGTRDTTFQPTPINGEVSAVAEQVNGRYVVVGAFTEVAGRSRRLVARLNGDGSFDPGFDPGAGLTRVSGQNVAFDVLVLPGGEIVVTGTFDQADGRPRNGAVMLSGDTLDLYFTREPADLELPPGANGELAANATGTSGVSYQWFKDGASLTGETAPTLRLTGATAAIAGDYQVVIRNASGELGSRVARVTVILPPVVSEPPRSLVVDPDGSASFSVAAQGLRMGYQWLFDGDPIPGATNATHALTRVRPDQAGPYAVRISNPAGSVTTDAALLRVRPVPVAIGGIPTNGIVGEVLFESDFAERTKRFPTAVNGTPTLVAGIDAGKAARFRSGTDWLRLGAPSARMVSASYSASFWIWAEERGSINAYTLTISASGFAREQHLYLGGEDDTIQGRSLLLGTRGYTSVESTDPQAGVPNLVGRWTHIAVVYRGPLPQVATNYTVYVDGRPLALATSTVTVSGSIASNGLGTYGPMAAFRMDDFRLYGRALDAAEVLRLRDIAPPPAGPAITRQPAGGSGVVGGAFSLAVEATGEGLFYEWYHGDTLIPEATGPVLTLAGLAPAQAGVYRVVISNPSGKVTSQSAVLTVDAGADPFAAWAAAAGLVGERALPGADPDGDGASNLAEFAFGTPPDAGSARPEFTVTRVEVDGVVYPAVAYYRRQQPGRATIEIATSENVEFNVEDATEIVTSTRVDQDRERVVVRGRRPVSAASSQFFRFTVTHP